MSMLRIATFALVYVSVLGIPSESRAQTGARKSAGTESVIQFRFVEDSVALGVEEVQWLTRDGRLYVSAEPLLSDSGIEHVGLHSTAEGLVLCLYLFEHARAPLREATGQGIGRQLAALINGRVVSVSRIMSAIGAGPPPISMGVYASRRIADEITASVVAQWPQRGAAGYCGTLGPSTTPPSNGSLRGATPG